MKKRLCFFIIFAMIINLAFPIGALAGEETVDGNCNGEAVVDREDAPFDYEAVMDAVHDGLISGNEIIDLSEFDIPYKTELVDGVNTETLGWVKLIISDAMQLFPDTYTFFSGGSFSGAERDGVKYVAKLTHLQYYKYDTGLFDAELMKVMKEAEDKSSDLEILTALHDQLVMRCDPAYEQNADAANAYGALAGHVADYEGYAKALALLYREAGFDSEVVRVMSDHNYSYFWTRVKVGDKCYNVDAYHDDTHPAKVRHKYLLLSDEEMLKTLGDAEGVAFNETPFSYLPAADGTEYDNAFWRADNIVTPLVFSDDSIFYGLYSRENENVPYYIHLYKAAEETPEDSGTLFYDLPTNSDYRLREFCGLFLLEDRLYFNNRMFIYSIDMNAQNRNKVYQKAEGEPDIYFCYYLDGQPGYIDEKGEKHPVGFRTDLVDDGKDDKDQEIGVVDEDGEGDSEDSESDNEDDSKKPTSTELIMTDNTATMVKGTVIGVNKFVSDNTVAMYTVDYDKAYIQYNIKKQTLKFKKETLAGPTYLTINGERFMINIIRPAYVKGANKTTLLVSSGVPGCDEQYILLPNSQEVSWGTIKYIITASAGCYFDYDPEEKKLEGVYLDEKQRGSIKVSVLCYYIDPVKNTEKKVRLGTFKIKVID